MACRDVKREVIAVGFALLLVLERGSSIGPPPLRWMLDSALGPSFSGGKGEDPGGAILARADHVVLLPPLLDVGHSLSAGTAPATPVGFVPRLGTSRLAMACSCFVLSFPWAGDKQRRAFPRKSLLGKPIGCSIYFAGLMCSALFSLANSSKCTQITLLLSAQVQTMFKAFS